MLGPKGGPSKRGNSSSSPQSRVLRTRPAESSVPGTNGGGGFQNPAADPGRPGSARRGREGGREEEPCEPTPPPRARAFAGWGWGWSRNSEAGARTGPGPGGGPARGREQRRRPPLAAGLFIPGKKFRSGR